MVLSRWLWFPACLALIVTAATASAESPFAFESTPGKLPKSVVPRHYALELRPDLERFTTHGTETVDIEVLKPVKEIVLNALGLEITMAALVGQQEMTLTPRLDAAQQTVVLPLPTELAPGKYRLMLEFNGRIGDRAEGLFYVKYAAPSGRKVMLSTQMEPTDARRMFPCWDEPSFRATYELAVVVPQKHRAVSNMPIESETPLAGGLKEVRFKRTPPMASYLVVLVSGELEELKGEVEGTQIRIITTEGKREQARYALDTTKKVLAYYNHYFDVKYPLPKLDQIAVPGGFTGAMENWGGITYNERNLLFDPKASALETKRHIFGVIAHEMAHQWFGDLVTMAWWDNLWLNEGFASWMGTKATDHFNPDWQVWLLADSERTGVMSDDARKTTHPIQTRIENESQANDAFDQITYRKGQAFLRMLENYLGENQFRAGIRRYIAAHRYSNTTTVDLWEALEQASGKPIKILAAGWTEQPGVPLVKVRADCVNGHQIVTLEQERFTVHDPDAKPLFWKIPVAMMNTERPGTVAFTLLENNTASTSFRDCRGAIKANAGNAGYYRVWYEPELFEKLKLAKLPVADRLNLLNDMWAMVEANRAPASQYLDLVESQRGEKSFPIWGQIIGTLDFIDELERGQPGRATFEEYVCTLLRPLLQRLGWEPKPQELSTDAMLRTTVIARLGQFGDKTVIAEARRRFEKFLANPGTLAADLRPPVLKIVGRYCNRATYDQLHELSRNAKGTEERRLYYLALCGALDPQLARTTLALSLTDETVPQETTHLVIDVAAAGEQPELAWDFAQAHMKDLLGRVETFRRNTYVPSILSACSSAARADELESYVKANISEDAMAKTREVAERIRLKAALKTRELPGIDKWIAKRPTARVE